MEGRQMQHILWTDFEGKRMRYEIDVKRKLTDCFFFNDASNIQTSGAILCTTYPCAMCFHGGEHVLSLIFSYLSKLKPIQVSPLFFACYFQFLFLA